MRFCVLGSGSKGNCTFVESEGTAVLIDAGFSGIEIERRLRSFGYDPAKLAGILVTHEHSDHVKGVGVLSRKYGLPVLANEKTRQAAGRALDRLTSFRVFETGKTFQLNSLAIHPFAINHDTADPVGFTIADGGTFFGYCTDTGMVSRLIHHHLALCQGLVLECNHDLEMLRNGKYPLPLQQRIRSKNGHLANPEAVTFLKALAHAGLKHVVLAHISESNNRPALVQQLVDQLWREIKAAGQHELDFRISLAAQDRVGELISLAPAPETVHRGGHQSAKTA